MMTIGIISMGAMGGPLAARLTRAGYRVLTQDNRSEASKQRAVEAKVNQVSFPQLVESCDMFISVLPPSEAVNLAKSVAGFDGKQRIFADLNAISPKTSQAIAKTVSNAHWIYAEGSIIGGPPTEKYDPTIYISGEDAKGLDILKSLEICWKIKVLENGGVGASKALKNSYAALTKGLSGLASGSVLAASAYSDATAVALLHELADSQPGILTFLSRSLPQVASKAYRFVGEMEEIGSYVDDHIGRQQGAPWRAIASRYEDAAADRTGEQAKILQDWANKARKLI